MNNIIFKTVLLKGMDGAKVVSMEKTATSGLVDTYTITYSDGTTEELTVTNGKGIDSITKTSTSGLTDTYTVTYNDSTTSTFTVTNGRGIVSIEKTSSSGLIDTYTITYNDGTTSTFTITNGLTTGLSDAQGNPLNVGDTQTPTYFSGGVPVATDIQTDITDGTKAPTSWTSVSGISIKMRGVTYGNGLFVAVGNSGVNYHSTNGVNWTAGTTAGSNELIDVTYGKGLFVAVGASGTNYHSTDGSNWTAGSAFSNIIYGVTYGNGLFVAVGNDGINYHSTDGSNWTAGTNVGSGTSDLYGVSYGNGLFVAVGSNGVNYHSTDGSTWTAGTIVVTTFLYGVTYGNGLFVAVGTNTITYAKVTNAQSITNVGKYINDNTQDIENINGRLGESNISTIGNGTVTGAISSLNTSLTKSYTTQGLTYASGVSYVAGGYVRCGNIVIINIRITTNGATIPAGAELVKGFPAYTAAYSTVWVTTNTDFAFGLTQQGAIYHNTTTTGIIVCSCVYMAS